MGMPEHETHRYIHELESLGLIKIQPHTKPNTDEKGREFRLISITEQGLQELSRIKLLDKFNLIQNKVQTDRSVSYP